jgi:hypothetical protein
LFQHAEIVLIGHRAIKKIVKLRVSYMKLASNERQKSVPVFFATMTDFGPDA